jgi:hypothetical protein
VIFAISRCGIARLLALLQSALAFFGFNPGFRARRRFRETEPWRLRFVVWFDQLLPATFLDCKTLRPSGIRLRVNATARQVKATDYVGQASRRHQLASLREIFSGRRAS